MIQIDTKWMMGDYAGARAAASAAKTWTLVSVVLGLAAVVIYGIIVAMGAASGMMGHSGY